MCLSPLNPVDDAGRATRSANSSDYNASRGEPLGGQADGGLAAFERTGRFPVDAVVDGLLMDRGQPVGKENVGSGRHHWNRIEDRVRKPRAKQH